MKVSELNPIFQVYFQKVIDPHQPCSVKGCTHKDAMDLIYQDHINTENSLELTPEQKELLVTNYDICCWSAEEENNLGIYNPEEHNEVFNDPVDNYKVTPEELHRFFNMTISRNLKSSSS